MDLSQTKLTKEEWNALEVPTTGREFDIIKMIHDAGNNVNVYMKNTQTFLDFIKISSNVDNYHYYIFENYFKSLLMKVNKKQHIFTYNFKAKKGKK